MQHNTRNCLSNSYKLVNEHSVPDYENSIRFLNSLQSNVQHLKEARNEPLSHSEKYAKKIVKTQNYLIRSGVTLETLDTLPVIHVTGTKGKGTTCALTESILRQHGFKTGFYSSPHLVEVRERIRINGEPLCKNTFAKNFWDVFNKLDNEKDFPNDMPRYFQFLTILAFKVFLDEKVDVAIIEVGIGGEYDSTNILRNVPVVGIISLGLDHTAVLGDTLEKIAWNKSGIMKPNSQVFTVPQIDSVMKVLRERSLERKSSVTVIQPPSDIIIPSTITQPIDIYKLNLGLALAMCETWMTSTTNGTNNKSINLELIKIAISNCKWPGRYQILKSFNNTYYLDGAHTLESLQTCADWFRKQTQGTSFAKALIFNVTGNRNSKVLMSELQKCNFQQVYFVPNKATESFTEDQTYLNTIENEHITRCHLHHNYWCELEAEANTNKANVKVLRTISEVFQECQNGQHDVLITGSLHLVGAALSILDPNLNSSNS